MAWELVILVDDNAPDHLRAQRGLSMLLSGAGKKALFDTAASGDVLLANAQVLGVDLCDLDAAVVSHGHCDHTGGLVAVAMKRPGLSVYAHPSAFSRRWVDRIGAPMKDISCPHSVRKLYEAGAVFCPVRAPEMLEDWLVLSGPVGGYGEPREEFLIRKGDEIVVDGFDDELFMLVRGQAGWVMVTGCCHRGLRNSLRAAHFLTHGEPVTDIVGGLHLCHASQQQIADLAAMLSQAGSPRLYPCHCTGATSIERLSAMLPGQVKTVGAGSRLVF